jgi:apolipoprotein N-acyltransferase
MDVSRHQGQTEIVKYLAELSSFLLAIVSGSLLALAHPFRWNDFVINSSWITFALASVGLCTFISVTLSTPSPRLRFAKAFIGGLAYFSACHYWLVSALTEFGGLSLWIAVLGAGYVAAHCATFLGIWALISGSQMFLQKSPTIRFWSWASLWVGLEAIRQWMTFSFHWGELGHHFHHSSVFFHSANIWGAHGLTFFWIFTACALVWIKDWSAHPHQVKSLGVSFGSMILIIVAGNVWARSIEPTGQIKVGLIQPNISQEIKWDPAKVLENIETLLRLSSQSAEQNPDLIVWPETAYPRLVSISQRKLPFSSQVPLIVGAVVRDDGNNRNSALLVQGDEILGRFDKEVLVPFGEYVPFQKILPLGKLVENAGDFIPGENQKPLELSSLNLKLGPLICYEDTFNRSSVERVRKGADLLVNMTNDAWYGKSSAQAQHTAIASFQVYQTLKPMVRSTNNGQTTMITPFERSDLEPFTSSSTSYDVPIFSDSRTFFVWTYPLMEWIWWLIFVIAAMWKSDRRTKKIFFPN